MLPPDYILGLRHAAQHSLIKAAAGMNLSPAQLDKFETGQDVPSYDQLLDIATYYGTPQEALLKTFGYEIRSTLEIRVQPCFPDIPLPRYASLGAAGADLHAALSDSVTLAPGERRLIPTGLKIAIPFGYEGQIRPRSGLSAKMGVTVINTPGTVDSDYRGEVKVCLVNHGDAPVVIKPLDRIAQLIISPVLRASWVLSESLESTLRGENGYGSTGA